MKTSLLLGAILALLGLAAAPLNAQTQTTTSTTSSSSGYIQTSKIIGTKVRTSSGDEIGVVKDVVIDRSTGCMAYTVVSAGGTGTRITGQAKMVAVPWAVYSTTTTDAGVLTVTVIMIESITRRCSTMHVSTNIPAPATSITSTRTTAFLPAVRQEQLTALRQVRRRPREQARLARPPQAQPRPARQRPVRPPHP